MRAALHRGLIIITIVAEVAADNTFSIMIIVAFSAFLCIVLCIVLRRVGRYRYSVPVAGADCC